MFYKANRDEQYMQKLTSFLLDNYNIIDCKITEAKRGFFGETWKIHSLHVDYFVKIDYWDYHKEIYQRSFYIIDYITQSGINHILKILKTQNGELYTVFNDGVLGMFEFVEGENIEDYPIERLFEKLVPIYKLPTNGLTIENETFDTGVVSKYKKLLQAFDCTNTKSSKQVLMLLNNKTELIERFGQRLKLFSERCKDDLSGFCITHGDAGGNCIISDDNFVIVDWDYPKLAPIERDAWFFMWSEDQIKIINDVLKQNNINCMLNSDRFCFYCYYSFFYYLTEYIQAYFCLNSEIERIKISYSLGSYFNSWILTQLNVADMIL